MKLLERDHPTLTIGEFVDELERVEREVGPDRWVYFDFGGLTPGEPTVQTAHNVFRSYRGHYHHLALSYCTYDQRVQGRIQNAKEGEDGSRDYGQDRLVLSVGELLAYARKASDRFIVHGYKGGEYETCRSTPLWVANEGDVTKTTIVKLSVHDRYEPIIHTSHVCNNNPFYPL